VKQKYFIDSHKGATSIYVFALIAAYGDWENAVAWVYLALHGTYGLLWIAKSRFFPDAQWEQRTSFAGGLGIWLVLTLYWIAPWLIVSGNANPVEPWFIGFCVALYTVGVFLHFVADMQKHLSLQLRPGVLITDGLWGTVRNPNYLGEFCIYAGFSLLALSWIPMVALVAVIAAVWIPNMLRKDKSLSRYPEFGEYAARTKLFIPYVW
jgi:protein-S-isoprenylcysteine O-methyltransferase Ste14